MTEYFEVVRKKQFKAEEKSTANSAKSEYLKLQEEFLTQSYGHYTEIFIKKIYEEKSQRYDFLLKHEFKKYLRETIKKFFLSDLQIIFFAYFADLNEWNICNRIIENSCRGSHKSSGKEIQVEASKLILFMNFIAFFVKTYLGKLDEINAIKRYLNCQENTEWEQLFQLWLKNSPSEYFVISPRQINTIYSQYSKNCQKVSYKKNYNQMVEKILELSTTYSMMPLNDKEIEYKKRNNGKGEKKIKQNEIIENKNSYNSFLQSSKRSQKKSMSLESIVEIHKEKQQLEEEEGYQIKEKKVTLKTKNRTISNAVNSNVTNFFEAKPSIFNQIKPESHLREPNLSYLDFNPRSMRSDRYEALPFMLRSNYSNSRLI